MKLRTAVLSLMLLTAGCDGARSADDGRPATAREFPRSSRPVSALGSNEFSTEVQRDTVNEAQTVMDLANIRPGMTVVDIGAGNGYYTVRLAERVGPKGRVLAQDIDAEALQRLAATGIRGVAVDVWVGGTRRGGAWGWDHALPTAASLTQGCCT